MFKVLSKYITLICFLFCSFCAQGQCLPDSMNVEVLYNYDDSSQPVASGNGYNDIWGYVAPNGREYGILGASDSIIIFDVTDPLAIVKVGSQPGTSPAIWRDMKTYGEFLYAGCDGCAEGILVFDLSTLPASFSQVGQFSSDFTSSHNIYIDSSAARLYAVGANSSSGIREGLAIYDLSTGAIIPPLLKKLRLDTLPGEVSSANYYIHDIFVKDNIAYCSHGTTGYGIWNVANVDSIYKLSLLPLPSTDVRTYVHSSWNTLGDSVAYIASEANGNRQIYVVNQKDPTATFLDTTWKEPLLDCGASPQTNNVPHNPYVVGNYVYISYYQDGIQILDISDPLSPVRAGYYDLDPTNTIYNGTSGNWGMYPFLPSGTILASDVDLGFFALQFTPSVVPLELLSFDVFPTSINSEAKLKWSVASAINVRHFEIQRSNNGSDFRLLDEISFDNNSDKYDFIDKNLDNGQYFYRLKTVDFDGTFQYSEVRTLKIEDEISIVVYPTTASNEIMIELSLNNTWNYSIYNSAGALVSKSTFSGKNNLIDISSFSYGVYHIQLTNGAQVVSSTFQKI